jgi:hypothetical protein
MMQFVLSEASLILVRFLDLIVWIYKRLDGAKSKETKQLEPMCILSRI